MAKVYQRYLRLLQNWPVRPDYPSPLRGLSEYLRAQGKVAFSARGDFTGNVQECDRRLKSLERLSRNHWSQAYPSSRQFGALKLTPEECLVALSDDFEQYQDSSAMSKTVQAVLAYFRGRSNK